MRILLDKFKEVLYSVLPITVIVYILSFTFTPLPAVVLIRFTIGAALIIIGLAIFLFGIDIGITPLGNHVGSAISKSDKIWIVAAVGLVVGFFISIAEPDLQILSKQVALVTDGVLSSMTILIVVSLGVGALLIAALVRIVYDYPLNKLLTIVYGIIFMLAIFVSPEFLAISFDASGTTTGSLTVPFMLALALGVSDIKKSSNTAEEDSFGLVAITSSGAIISIMIMGIINKINGLSGVLIQNSHEEGGLLTPFFEELKPNIFESFIALLPVLLIFLAFQFKIFKFKKKQVKRIIKGLLYAFIGLVLFLTGVNAGFMDAGAVIGKEIVQLGSVYAVIVGFIIGFVTILAEPAVHVLTNQIELVTSGYVKKNTVLGALAIGLGIAVALSVIRIIVPYIQLWHYLLPGYIISIVMSYFIPKLFVGIAFDSGGVASGSMTATFILAFTQGIADFVPGADVLRDGFGVIALAAMTPIITLQALGIIVKIIDDRQNRKITSGEIEE